MVCWSRIPGGALSAWTSSLLPSRSEVNFTAAFITSLVQAGLSQRFKFLTSFNREFRVAAGQRFSPEESSSSLFVIASCVLHALLPGRRSSHTRSSSVWEVLHQLPAAQQSLHLLGNRKTERSAPSVPAIRPPAPLCAAGKEASLLQGSMSPRVPREPPVPDPHPQPPQPSGTCFFSPPSSLRHFRPVLSLPLPLPPEPSTHKYFPACKTSR